MTDLPKDLIPAPALLATIDQATSLLNELMLEQVAATNLARAGDFEQAREVGQALLQRLVALDELTIRQLLSCAMTQLVAFAIENDRLSKLHG